MKLYGITGWKNAGKTGLTERLVREITARGFTVSTIKHSHHNADVDHVGTDSYRHRAAGAGEVVLASSSRIAYMTELRGAKEPQLDQIVARMSPVDLILVEGYKRADHPKIEAYREIAGHALMAPTNASVRAVASDVPLSTTYLSGSGDVSDCVSGCVSGAGTVAPSTSANVAPTDVAPTDVAPTDVGLASHSAPLTCPVFDLNDTGSIADFILHEVGL
jgi:molybdopterin-guanine dinucleotide biosynthesis protein MobB